MDDLVEWLRAQLDEDERVALAASGDPPRLGEVEAKRLRLDEFKRELADDDSNETVRWLLQVEALPYSDRPGYREEWRATG